jgi:predicted enzyme related to lactoylglutathione lyase
LENAKHPTFGNGKVCYLEIPAIDVNRSASFYKAVFGWQIRQRSNGQLTFDDSVNEVSGTWATGREAATKPGLLVCLKEILL